MKSGELNPVSLVAVLICSGEVSPASTCSENIKIPHFSAVFKYFAIISLRNGELSRRVFSWREIYFLNP